MTTPFLRAVGIVVGMFLLLAVFAACGTTPSTQTSSPASTPAPPTATPKPPTATPAPSVAYQLATIDAQGTPDAATVAKYQKLITSLHDKTGDSEQVIADDTVKGQQLLQQHGKNATLLDLLSGVDTSITKAEHQKYADTLAALITIMEN